MKKNKKILIIAIMAVILVVAGVAGFVLNKVNTNSNMKKFAIVIESERDGFNSTIECKTDLGTLGEYVRTMEECTWEDSAYGTYITGWCGYDQDLDNQYWWAIYVDNEQSNNGADLIELQDGHEYEFKLIQGW